MLSLRKEDTRCSYDAFKTYYMRHQTVVKSDHAQPKLKWFMIHLQQHKGRDYLSSGANSLKDATTLYGHKQAFANAKMNIRKLKSNSKEAEKFIYANEENNRDLIEKLYAWETLQNIQKCDLKVLEIFWKKKDDRFKLKVSHLKSSIRFHIWPTSNYFNSNFTIESIKCLKAKVWKIEWVIYMRWRFKEGLAKTIDKIVDSR